MPIDFVTLALAKQMIGGDGGEGSSVKIDTTLTKKGFAADARAVGKALGKKIAAPSTANIGQTIVVEAVDENGKPVEWEAVDMPEAVMVDPTLTAEGAAADAKAAGDAIVQKSQVQIITWEDDD